MEFAGDESKKLKHLAMRPMNGLQDLGLNTAHMNQQPENPFSPCDRVIKRGDRDVSTAIVVEVLPSETKVELYGQELDGEAVRVVFPSALDEGAGDWKGISDALLSSYCDDQEIKICTYKYENIKLAE